MSNQIKRKIMSGIYHVEWQCRNKQEIFEEEQDYCQFIETLKQFADECSYKIHAFCLMEDHVHILIEVGKTSLSKIMKKIDAEFEEYYNRTHGLNKFVIHGKYKSEPVNSKNIYLETYKNILQNPVKAGLTQNAFAYHWSSAMAVRRGCDFLETSLFKSFFRTHYDAMVFLSC